MTAIQQSRVRKLVEALRSGHYAQTRGRLRDAYGFCCLGVACDVYRKETGKADWDGYKFLQAGSSMPAEVWTWFGFTDGNPNVKEFPDYDSITLTGLNDGGANFERIANAIEKNFLQGEEVVSCAAAI